MVKSTLVDVLMSLTEPVVLQVVAMAMEQSCATYSALSLLLKLRQMTTKRHLNR